MSALQMCPLQVQQSWNYKPTSSGLLGLILKSCEQPGCRQYSAPLLGEDMGVSLGPEMYLWVYGCDSAFPIHSATGTDTAFPRSPHL